MSNDDYGRGRHRHSYFWPLLLIALGVIFLLSNFHLVQGSAWSIIARLWPLLLILGGLDGYLHRRDWAINTFFIALGILFLLSNFGYIAVSIWTLLTYLWPIFIVAIGLDLIVGRRSWWGALVGVVGVLLVFGATLAYVGFGLTSGSATAQTNVSQQAGAATSATISIEPIAGDLVIQSQSDPAVLISGSVPEGSQIYQDYKLQGETASFRIWQTGPGTMAFIPSPGRGRWDLSLNQTLPLSLKTVLVAGDHQEQLQDLTLSSLDVSTILGNTQITLPKKGRFSGNIKGVIGNITINVPKGMELKVTSSNVIAAMSVPDGYTHEGNVYTSPGYGSSENQIDLNVSEVIGLVQIQQ